VPHGIDRGFFIEQRTLLINCKGIVKLRIKPDHRKVANKLSRSIRGKGYKSGLIWVYFKHTGKMVYWTVEGLK
jgi:hypothetical protein